VLRVSPHLFLFLYNGSAGTGKGLCLWLAAFFFFFFVTLGNDLCLVRDKVPFWSHGWMAFVW
jgi:hypothetical protein